MDIQAQLPDAHKTEAQAFALGELSRLFAENDKDINPFVLLSLLFTMHESGMLTLALGSEERSLELIEELKTTCNEIIAVKRRRRIAFTVVFMLLAVLGSMWLLG